MIAPRVNSVPFIDLTRDVAAHRDDYLRITARVLDSGIFSLGQEVAAFERAFADYLGVKHVIGVNGGTQALYASCLALGIGPGDEVIVPANSFIATAEAVVMAGATPKFCDADPNTFHLDLASCERLLTSKTKAVMPVHLYGLAMDLTPVLAWAKEKNLFVIEDTAQAHGAIVDGKRAGTSGTFGCFSFYPTKNLGSLGEGGAIATNVDALAELVRGIRVHGCVKTKYRHDVFGSNLKMEALQGAFLTEKLVRLDRQNARRREIAQAYRRAFADLPLDLPADAGEAHVYHLFVVAADRRDELKTHLETQWIGTGIHYPDPIHLQPAFAKFGGKPGDCPVAERLSARILSLSMFPELRDDEIEEVIRAVRAFFHL